MKRVLATLAASVALVVASAAPTSANPAWSAQLAQATEALRNQVGPGAQVICSVGVRIRANENGGYVVPETIYPYHGSWFGMLRARATISNTTGYFNVCREQTTGRTNLYSQSLMAYVSSELNYKRKDEGMLRARKTGYPNSWETFVTPNNPGGGITWFRAANGTYVTAELNYDSDRRTMLRARNGAVNQWETFVWVSNS